MKNKLMLAGAAVIALGLAAPAVADMHGDKKDYGAKAEKMEKKADMTIVEIAASKDKFSTLVTAVTEAGLADTLSGEGPFTVFAPTNEAFEALPEGTLEELLKPENKEQLANILKLHVSPGKIKSTDIQPGMTEVATAAGNSLTVEAGENGVMVEGAKVTYADIVGKNGVIHVIDKVILPE